MDETENIIEQTEVEKQVQTSTVDIAETPDDFTIPEEYKSAEWSKDIKSVDDLWNYRASAESNQDLKKADLDTVKKYFSKFAPENTDDYNIIESMKNKDGEPTYELNNEVKDYFGGVFKDLGVPVQMGQELVKKVCDFEISQFHKATDIEDLNCRLKNIFGDDDKTKRTCEGMIKDVLPREDLDKIDAYMPNPFVEIMYKLAKGLSDNYGYKEPTAHTAGRNYSGGNLSKEEKDTKYSETLNKIRSLSRRPHSADEKKELLTELEKYV